VENFFNRSCAGTFFPCPDDRRFNGLRHPAQAPGVAGKHQVVNMASARKILVIDDNPVILKALLPALKSQGHEVYAAMDGPEAFSIARRGKLDLILLDIFFPPDTAQSGNTWDAFLIIDWLRRIGMGDAVPIVIMSGTEPEGIKERCLAAGAAAFLSKPIDTSRLLETIDEIFSRKAEPIRPGRAASLPINYTARSFGSR
jgi:CheY-like chemotaxis protein